MSDSSSPGTPPEPTRATPWAPPCRICGEPGFVNVTYTLLGAPGVYCREHVATSGFTFPEPIVVAPLAPSSAPAPEHLPEQEQDEGKTSKSEAALPSQLESRASRDATRVESGVDRITRMIDQHLVAGLSTSIEHSQARGTLDVLVQLAGETDGDAIEQDAMRYRALHPYLRGCFEYDARGHVLRLGERTIPTLVKDSGWTGALIDAAADYAVSIRRGVLPVAPERPEAAAVDRSRSSHNAGAAALTPTLAAPTGAAAPTWCSVCGGNGTEPRPFFVGCAGEKDGTHQRVAASPAGQAPSDAEENPQTEREQYLVNRLRAAEAGAHEYERQLDELAAGRAPTDDERGRAEARSWIEEMRVEHFGPAGGQAPTDRPYLECDHCGAWRETTDVRLGEIHTGCNLGAFRLVAAPAAQLSVTDKSKADICGWCQQPSTAHAEDCQGVAAGNFPSSARGRAPARAGTTPQQEQNQGKTTNDQPQEPHTRGKVMSTTTTNIAAIARVCHEANRAYCATIGDSSQVAWDDAPDWQKSSAINGVEKIAVGETTQPSDSHASWSAEKEATGWVYGPTKDAVAKTHPCLVPFDELPPEQQAKDRLFFAVANALLYT